jgi:hypothetical protein
VNAIVERLQLWRAQGLGPQGRWRVSTGHVTTDLAALGDNDG